jgi:hypothetical protein
MKIRHAQKARITVKEELAEALERSYSNLKEHLKNQVQDLDQDIQVHFIAQK